MAQVFPPTILYGADSNPEQWPEEVWLEDMRLMKLAAGTYRSLLDEREVSGEIELAARAVLVLLATK